MKGHRPITALFVVLALILTACARPDPAPSRATPLAGIPGTGIWAPPAASLGSDPVSGLPLVALSDLPPEATETMGLIRLGGPHPYRQDGAVFENREGILPDAGIGDYHEYTVVTPGSADRGARRIVVGRQGEAYWTDDHYVSFSRIAP